MVHQSNPPVRENFMDLSILTQFGLAANDIKTYQALLQLGKSKVGPIMAASRVGNSRTYASLKNLIDRGLVSYEVKNNIRYYRAEMPDTLIEATEKNIHDLRATVESMKSVVNHTQTNETNVYEGLHGFKQSFEKHVASIPKGSQVSVIAFGGKTVNTANFTRLRSFFNHVDQVTFGKSKDVRMLLERKLEPLLKKDRALYKQYKLRFLPSGYFSPAAINLSQNEVMISVWEDKPIVFTMNNPIVVASFQKNFEFLWQLAKE